MKNGPGLLTWTYWPQAGCEVAHPENSVFPMTSSTLLVTIFLCESVNVSMEICSLKFCPLIPPMHRDATEGP